MAKYYSPEGNFEVWDEKPQGYFTEDEWNELHPPTPYIPTKEEKIAALDAQYAQDKAQLIADYNDAVMHDDNETAAAVKDEMASIDAQYDEEYRKIETEVE